MPADLWLAVGFLGVVVAAALLVCGVWKIDVRLLAAGAVLAGLVWFGIACTNTVKWTSHEFVTLRLRPVDASSREMIEAAVVEAVEVSDAGRSAACRLPTRLHARAGKTTGVLEVSLVVELEVEGALVEQYYEPGARARVADQDLEISAPSYRPWRGTLRQLLPEGWPATPPAEVPITVELQPLR